MDRARFALVVLLATAAGASVAPAVSAARGFSYTHRVSVSGQFVDHWTVNDPSSCGPVGDGSVTVNYHTRRAVKVKAMIDPYFQGQGPSHNGAWVLLAPRSHQITALPGEPAVATVTKVDNTSRQSQFGGDCGGPSDNSACASAPLKRAQSELNGYDRRSLAADLGSADFTQDANGRLFSCQIGSVSLFSSPPSLVGGTARGELLIKMPKPSTLAHRRVVRVTGTSHKSSTSADADGTVYTDDVTRTVTVTFRHL